MTQLEFGNDDTPREWIRSHGGLGKLEDKDVPGLKKGVRLAWELLRDGATRSAEWIEANHGSRAAMRRVRDLRPLLAPFGMTVITTRDKGRCSFNYRIGRIENNNGPA